MEVKSVPEDGEDLERVEARFREKERQLRPDPRRPWRNKAVRVYGLSVESRTSS